MCNASFKLKIPAKCAATNSPILCPQSRVGLIPQLIHNCDSAYSVTNKAGCVKRVSFRDASASIQANVGAHFSQRALIYSYPRKVGEADFIVLHLENPSRRNLLLPHLLLMEPAAYLDSVSELLDEERYGMVFWNDPWLILQRDVQSKQHEEGIRIKIEQLRKAWNTK